MRKSETKDWRPYKNTVPSNKLLESYCGEIGGTAFAEVKIEDDPYPYPREIDAVRFATGTRKLKTWSREDGEFNEQLSRAKRNGKVVEIIEVITPKITRGVIGQLVVGRWLLEEKCVKVRMVLVCNRPPAALKKLLKKHEIEVWSPS